MSLSSPSGAAQEASESSSKLPPPNPRPNLSISIESRPRRGKVHLEGYCVRGGLEERAKQGEGSGRGPPAQSPAVLRSSIDCGIHAAAPHYGFASTRQRSATRELDAPLHPASAPPGSPLDALEQACASSPCYSSRVAALLPSSASTRQHSLPRDLHERRLALPPPRPCPL
jgi:hypothetical protein